MDIKLSNHIAQLMHANLARQLLTKYFRAKNIENWDMPISPEAISDLAKAIPELYQKVEVIPYVVNLDPLTGLTKIGWNIFVLGNKRLYLGITQHKNLGELISLRNPITDEKSVIEKATTPRKIIDFICNQLKDSEDGRLEFYQPTSLPQFMRRPNITAPYASYYEKRKWGK